MNFEGFKIGSEGLGVRFTQAEVDWLTLRDQLYCGVPEPSSLVLLMIGGLVFVGYRWRRKSVR